MITLLCVLLTAILFFYIFYMEEEIPAGEEKTRLAYLYERKDVIYDNLRDLNFEYRSGKFPETDFQAMRSTLEDEAAHVLAEIEELEDASGREALTKSREGARN